MKALFIPPLGTEIELGEPWTFDLYQEHRNFDFNVHLGIIKLDGDSWQRWSYRHEDRSSKVTLQPGTLMKVDRIYIRRGCGDFDSVTFRMSHQDGKKLKKSQRFWVKLVDANKIVMKEPT